MAFNEHYIDRAFVIEILVLITRLETSYSTNIGLKPFVTLFVDKL